MVEYYSVAENNGYLGTYQHSWLSIWGKISHRLILKSFIPFLWSSKADKLWNSPCGPLAKTPCSQCRGPGLIPGQGTRFHMPQLKSPCAATKTSAAKIIKEGDVKQVWLCIATFKNAQHVTASWQFGQCSAGGGGGVISGGRLEGQGRRHQQVHWPPFPTRPVAEAGCHPGALGLPATWWLRSEDKSWGRARHDPYCLWWPSLRSHIVSLLPILVVEYGKVPSRLKRGRKRLFPMMWRTCETRPTAVPFSGNNTFH